MSTVTNLALAGRELLASGPARQGRRAVGALGHAGNAFGAVGLALNGNGILDAAGRGDEDAVSDGVVDSALAIADMVVPPLGVAHAAFDAVAAGRGTRNLTAQVTGSMDRSDQQDRLASDAFARWRHDALPGDFVPQVDTSVPETDIVDLTGATSTSARGRAASAANLAHLPGDGVGAHATMVVDEARMPEWARRR
jgi:hypothetical protein